MAIAGSSIDVDIPYKLEVRRVGGIRSRMEDLRGSLRLSEGISIGEPGLNPSVVDHVGVGNHGLLRNKTSATIGVLRGENVLLSLRVDERDDRSLGRDWCVNFEALFLIRGRVRLH